MKIKTSDSLKPSQKFARLLKQVLAVPKSEIDRREALYKKERAAMKTKFGDGKEEAAEH